MLACHGVLAGETEMLKKRFFKTKSECEVTFELKPEETGDDAVTVELLCEANGWQPVEMKKNKSGAFRTKMRFPKEGEFQFLYRVNERAWLNDDTADAQLPNGFGGMNSVLRTDPSR
jgi:hypothetical protein